MCTAEGAKLTGSASAGGTVTYYPTSSPPLTITIPASPPPNYAADITVPGQGSVGAVQLNRQETKDGKITVTAISVRMADGGEAAIGRVSCGPNALDIDVPLTSPGGLALGLTAIVALGATAARSLFGRVVTITRMRGETHRLADGTPAFVTIHPSWLLRIEDKHLRSSCQ